MGGIRLWFVLSVLGGTAFAQQHLVAIEHDGTAYTRDSQSARQRAARAFFATHADVYDFLIVYPTFPVDLGDETLGLHSRVRSSEQGIGRTPSDSGEAFGSRSRLKGYIDVGSLAVNTPPSIDDDLGIIAHEVGHQWVASVRFRDPVTSLPRTDLLGHEGGHWSFFFDSDGSVFYGSDWTSTPTGFEAGQSRRRYASLDLYLMGLLAPENVAPLTLIRPQGTSTWSAESLPPPPGTTIQGTPLTIRIEDILAVEGPRVPSHVTSQKEFRAAFVLLTAPGTTPTAAQLAHVDQVRTRFMREFFLMTRGKAIIETELAELGPRNIGQVPGLRGAIDFLVAAQRDGGSWSDDSRTTTRDTSATVEALSKFRDEAAVAQARARALEFLDGGVPVDSDARNRRAIALSDLNVATQSVGNDRYTPAYGRTPLDSALTLQALAAVGPVTKSTAEWLALRAEQLPSGGWPATTGGPARVEPTARALIAISRLTDKGREEEDIAAKGALFLRSSARASGLFGDDVDSVSNSALALIAMASWGRLTATEAERARTALLSLQRADGSWNGRAYDTACAVSALSKVLVPNLAISSVSLSRPEVVAGLGTTATIVVRNSGLVSSEATTLALFDDLGTTLVPPLVVPALVPGQSKSLIAPFVTTAAMIGNRSLLVIADPSLATSDAQRSDNLRSIPFTVVATPNREELFVAEGSIAFSPAVVTRLPQTITASVLVGNSGTLSVVDALVSVFGDGAGGSTTVSVPAQSSLVVQVPIAVTFATGDLPLTARISSFDLVPSNNFTTGILPFRRETAVALTAASVSRGTILQGEDAELVVNATSLGTAETTGATLSVDVLDSTGTLVVTLPASPVALSPSNSTTRTFRWRASSAGTFSFVVRLDAPGDTTAGDDTRVVTFAVSPSTKGNLSVGAGDIVVSPDPPSASQSATVTARVRNTGAFVSPAFEAVLQNGATGQELIRTTLGALAPGATTTVSTSITPATGASFDLVWNVDVGGAFDEFDEADNTAALTVRPRGLADLAVSAAEVIVTPAFPRPGDATTISVTVTNRGAQAAATSQLEFFQDGQTTPFATATVPGLAANAAVVRTVSWTAPPAAARVSIAAVVNASRLVPEETYDNNRAAREVSVVDGAFVLSEPFFSPNGDGVKDFTQVRFGAASSPARVRVVNTRGAQVWASEVAPDVGLRSATWSGTNDAGVLVEDGHYVLTVEDDGGLLGQAVVVVDTNHTRLSDPAGSSFVLAPTMNRGVSIPWRSLLFEIGGEYRGTGQFLSHLGGGKLVFIGETNRTQTSTGYRVECAVFAQDIIGQAPAIVSPPGWPCWKEVYQATNTTTGQAVTLVSMEAPVAIAAGSESLVFYLRVGGPKRIRSTTTVSTHEQPGATQGRWRRERRGQFEFVSGSAAG